MWPPAQARACASEMALSCDEEGPVGNKLTMAAVGAALVLGLAACGGEGAGSGGGPAAASAAPEDLTIGVSMPTQTSERWIADGENVQSQLEEKGYSVELAYANDDIP